MRDDAKRVNSTERQSVSYLGLLSRSPTTERVQSRERLVTRFAYSDSRIEKKKERKKRNVERRKGMK